MYCKILIILLAVSFSGFPLRAADSTFYWHLELAQENDLYFAHDYYYSNGLHIGFYHDKLEASPVNRFLFAARQEAMSNSHYGLLLRQEIYTPRDIASDSLLPADHPYSANLTLTQVKIINLPEKGIRYTTGLRIGVFGPASLGSRTQRLAHLIYNPSRPPQGWEVQMHNDLILNYDLLVEKSLYRNRTTMMGILGGSRLGTLHSDLDGGAWFRFDRRNGYFDRIGPGGGKGLNTILHLAAGAKYVFYDATLQGGMFNKTSPHVIPAEHVIRLLANIEMSLTFELQGHQLVAYALWSTKRFTDASTHGWMGIAYKYWFY